MDTVSGTEDRRRRAGSSRSRAEPRGRRGAVAAVLVACLAVLPGATCQTSGDSWPGGIGAVLRHSSSEHRLVLAEVPEGTPAAEADLRADDEIVAIDGREVAGMDVQQVVQALRGEVGSRVRLEILRGEEQLEVELMRAPYRERE